MDDGDAGSFAEEQGVPVVGSVGVLSAAIDAGTETQLEHGQGIGLWFVSWTVTQLGGEIQFQENDPEGSLVTVRLYDPVQ
jgi:sensor histidine kinase regulating citrate/malate metabolism